MRSRRRRHRAYVLGRAAVFSAILGLQGVAAEERPDVPFAGGDVIVRTEKCLALIRGQAQVTTFGETWPIGADDRGRLWAGAADEDKIRLRCYTSTAKYEDYVTSPVAEDVQLHKVQYWGNSPYVLFSIPWEGAVDGPWTEEAETETMETPGRIRGRWVQVVSLEPSRGSFRRPIPLSDFFGRPEIVMRSRELVDGRPLPKGVRDTVLDLGLWDAAITPSGTLWLSTQGKITAYRIGGLPVGLTKLLNPAKIEGLGQRTQKIDWWISRHGNGTGIAALSDTEIAVVYVNVNHPKASDTNPGTEQLPLRSVSRGAALALANRDKGSGTKILIAPGVYRDAVRLPQHGKDQSDAPIIFEATRNGKAVVTGSDVFDEWHRVEGEENLYWHHWPHKWGPREQVTDPVWIRCGIFYRPILLRRETVYCNGRLLKLVLSPLDLREGTHYVSEDEEKLIAWLPKGLDARTALMEVPVRDRLFVAQRQINIVVRGLVVRHDNSYFGMSSACAFGGASRNVLIEDCRFEWNNCGGCGFNTCRDLTVRRVVSNNNGGTGLAGCRLHNVLFEDTENSYNNWRGQWGEYDSWSVGGTKFLVIHGAVFRRNRSVGNHALGFWFDTDCTDVLVDGAWWVGNDRAAIFIEANQGPIAVRNSVMAMNEDGVTSTNSSRITLENNLIYGNRTSQLGLMGARDREIKTWNWGGKREDIVTQIRDWTLHDNVIVSSTKRQACLNLTYQDPDLFVKTLTSDGNTWFGLTSPHIISLAGVRMTLDEWRTATGQDVNSRFADPGLVDPQDLNFWRMDAARGLAVGCRSHELCGHLPGRTQTLNLFSFPGDQLCPLIAASSSRRLPARPPWP